MVMNIFAMNFNNGLIEMTDYFVEYLDVILV